VKTLPRDENRVRGIAQAAERRSGYHRLPIAEKRAAALVTMREPAVVCPICETHTTARDLLDHLRERCGGRREPHPGSVWVTWREALKMGVPRQTLLFWVRRRLIRFRGQRGDRRYLLRDLAVRRAGRMADRRR
jgi:hypothetical protein